MSPVRRWYSQLCRSVPQIPLSSCRSSSVPGAGSGTSYSRIWNSLPTMTTARPVRTAVPAPPARVVAALGLLATSALLVA